MEGYLSFYFLALVLSISVNMYFSYRLFLLPYYMKEWCSGNYLMEPIISRRDKELELILDEVMKKAEEKGFKIDRPRVRVLKRGLGLLEIGGAPARACALARRNRILFDGKWFRVNDYLIRSIMAHELGHIVDYQTKRRGHPLFEKIRDVSNELFADAFAAFLYSKEDVLEFREPRYYLADFNKEKFMKLDISIDTKPVEIRSEDIATSPIANTA